MIFFVVVPLNNEKCGSVDDLVKIEHLSLEVQVKLVCQHFTSSVFIEVS